MRTVLRARVEGVDAQSSQLPAPLLLAPEHPLLKGLIVHPTSMPHRPAAEPWPFRGPGVGTGFPARAGGRTGGEGRGQFTVK